MKRDWKPGDVAWLTIYGESSHLGMRSAEMGGSWVTAAPAAGVHLHGSHDVTDVRPLVVIDPEDREQVERLVKALSTGQPLVGLDPTNREMVDRAWVTHTQAALREFANPTPPKPEEPTGLGAVVEDADSKRWVRSDETDDLPWHETRGGGNEWREYSEIAAVRVLSEGVAS